MDENPDHKVFAVLAMMVATSKLAVMCKRLSSFSKLYILRMKHQYRNGKEKICE